MQKKNENKKNKKVVVVAAMALLLALVGISGGETYAKYASSQSNNDKATVAKWGYVVSVDVADLFGESYSDHNDNLCTPLPNDTGVNVNAATDSTNIVAPGTTGSMTMSVNGDAEVLSQINTDFEIQDIVLKTTDGQGNSNVDYYPLHWTIKVDAKYTEVGQSVKTFDFDPNANDVQNTKTFNGVNAVDDIDDVLDAVDTFYTSIKPNTSIEYTLTLSWEWKFSNNKDTEDTVFGGLVNKAIIDANNGNISWPQVNGGDDKSYIYQNGEQELVFTDNGSVFQTKVSGSVSVSQIQNPVQP